MLRCANLYDICDPVLRGASGPVGEPGRNLQLLYRRVAGHPLLKNLVLKGCRQPLIDRERLARFQDMMRAALYATPEQWRDGAWIEATFRPLAELLDTLEIPRWQIRREVPRRGDTPSQADVRTIIESCLRDIRRVWRRDRRDPWFPVAAQIVLSGDDHMDGESLMSVLRGVGSYEYQNITVLFALIRCFLMATPRKLRLIRRPYRGISEPMSGSFAWIWHRIAFSDVNFFEHLLVLLASGRAGDPGRKQLVGILENLLRYCVITSREWLVTPNRGTRHPAVTCLPKDSAGRPLCRLSAGAWRKKRELGFGDYVPDTDTTFLTLAMARKWLDWAARQELPLDRELLGECEAILDHPWVEIIQEYQVGGGYDSNPPTIRVTRPLDYDGAVPIWFDKPFRKPDGSLIRETVGNEICPGHNMDILDSILVNRKQWRALEGANLEFSRRLLDFHHRAFVSGNFRAETAHMYYLPEIYTYYLGRLYQTWKTLEPSERLALDPGGRIEEMRGIAAEYCRNELVSASLNAFDAALAVSALVLLEYRPRDDGTIAAGVGVLRDSLGEGRGGHPYKAYEWNRMRHPTRILVGSGVSTSLFVLRACCEAERYLFGGHSGTGAESRGKRGYRDSAAYSPRT